jgi:hypothetical protein
MNRSLLSIVVLSVGLLLAAGSVFAHHSVSGEFDGGKVLDFTGTVKTVEWVNPHIYTRVEVTDANGKTMMYRVEGNPPNTLFRAGWRKDSLKPGTVVRFKGIGARNPESINANGELSLPDGTKLWMGKGPEARD